MIHILRTMKRREWELFAVIIGCVLLQVWLDLRVPDYMAEITRLVKTPGSSLTQIWQAGGRMLVSALGSLAAAIGVRYLTARLGTQFAWRLRRQVFDSVEDFSMAEIDRFTTASLITRSTNDVTQIQTFVSGGLQNLIVTPVTFVLALVKINGRQWQWSAFTAVSVLLLVCVLIFVVRYAHPRQRRIQALTDDLNKVMRESLTGVRVIRAYNAEAFQDAKFDRSNQRLTENSLQARKAMGLMRPTMRFTNNFINIGIYVIGAYLISRTAGTAQLTLFSDMVVFSSYASRIVRSFMGLNRIFMMLPRANVSADRISEVLAARSSLTDGPQITGPEAGTVEFRHVCFRYGPDQPDILQDISFSVAKGQTVAIIGATGSGKSTLVNLIPRFYDATAGTVLVNGRDVREYRQQALHDIVGYTPQRAVLLTGTVASNVAYGAAGPDQKEDLKTVLEVAQAWDFVAQMPQGVDSPIARGGTNVSGGQKQRLSVARTILRHPQIYVFDDTFSALDYKTDLDLRTALKRYTHNATTLIVAQRIGTIRDADRIMVMDQGRIIDQGTHQELLKRCRLYREIAETQLSEEELANA